MWDKRIRRADWLAIAPTVLLAALTLWVTSYPIVDTVTVYFGMLAFSVVAIVWSAVLFATVTDRGSQAAALALLVGSIVANPFAGGFSLLFLALTGTGGLIALFVVGLALLALIVARSRPRRLAWLVPPMVVLAMFGVLITGAPRFARVAVSEAALTSYAEDVRALPVYYDEGLNVGAIPIYAAYNVGGGLHLVTGYVGILSDDEAGLAYLPSGPPSTHFRYEHVLGPWYRWLPY